MSLTGTPQNPLRVAIIGSGPSGFYAAEHLQKQKNLTIEIDMFDRLPTPYGLVRGGVSPDHQKIKAVTKVYDRIAAHPAFRFFGNVEFGTDITRDDLTSRYHAVIYAVGAQSDRRLDVPGEDLPGSHAATEFVAWYNAHPDYRGLTFDLSQESVAVVGVGNVAMDVARILGRSRAELEPTDIADYALEALASSRVQDIYILGRRGPAQAAFTNPEIRELGEMEVAEVVVRPEDMELDPLSEAFLASGQDKVARKNVEQLRRYAETPLQGKPRRIHIRFLVSPVEIMGTEQGGVEAIKVVKNELYQDDRGTLCPRPTGEFEIIPVGLVFRSVGYRGTPLPDVPFHEPWGTIPHDKGRVITRYPDGETLTGQYAVGWIKRGPYGVIGTNKPCAVETVESLLEDIKSNRLLQPTLPRREAVDDLLHERGIRYITYEDWLIIDRIEQERGQAIGRLRVKFSDIDDVLEELDKYKSALPDPASD